MRGLAGSAAARSLRTGPRGTPPASPLAPGPTCKAGAGPAARRPPRQAPAAAPRRGNGEQSGLREGLPEKPSGGGLRDGSLQNGSKTALTATRNGHHRSKPLLFAVCRKASCTQCTPQLHADKYSAGPTAMPKSLDVQLPFLLRGEGGCIAVGSGGQIPVPVPHSDTQTDL